jgi:hypothetical protein
MVMEAALSTVQTGFEFIHALARDGGSSVAGSLGSV